MNWVYWGQFLPLTFNVALCVTFLFFGGDTVQWGKVLYWGGATILTVGIILMEG